MNPDSEQLLREMETLGDIRVTVRAELDQGTFSLAELLELEPGGLVSLGRPTGENIDIYAEEVLIGWGEVGLLDGGLTVRIANLRNAAPPDVPQAGEEEPMQGRYAR